MGLEKFKETKLKPNSDTGSGRVRRLTLPDGKTRITQITTFCPDIIGPGPTHVYLIEDDAPILLDTGIPTFLAKAFFYNWRNQDMPDDIRLLRPDHSEIELLDGIGLGGYSVGDIARIIISHGHLDHFLMTNAIRAGGRPGVSAHVLDTPSICNPWGLLHMWVSGQGRMRATGMPLAHNAGKGAREIVEAGVRFDPTSFSVPVDNPILGDGPLKVDGSVCPAIEVRHIPGHSPGSIGLLVGREGSEKVLLCGDVLLFPITPHPDDLLVYLRTLNRLKSYEDVALVLPAHGKAIHNLPARVEYLLAHHRRRLKQTFEACKTPRCVWDIASKPNYFDAYVDPDKFNFLAGSEALVHMEMLAMVDGLRRCDIRNSVHYYRNSGEPFDEVYGRIAEAVADESVNTMMRY